jgi:3-methyl-2-oxobutanoate hydroxymethyltransferase
MVSEMAELKRRVRVTDIKKKKQAGEKIAMLTAYDATMARLLERAGIEILLVGDSLGMVIMGEETTIPVTLEAMIHHTRAVTRGARRAVVVADMPFLTYQASVAEAVHNAGRLLREGGATAVKVEGGRTILPVVERLTNIGVPVMGHLGLVPQSVHQLGGLSRQASGEADAANLLQEAIALEQAGAFAVVLESIPPELAQQVTSQLAIPTIGIGAGPHCDGQVLVSYDALGLFDEFVPPFVKQFAKLGDEVVAAAGRYADEVRSGEFPK